MSCPSLSTGIGFPIARASQTEELTACQTRRSDSKPTAGTFHPAPSEKSASVCVAGTGVEFAEIGARLIWNELTRLKPKSAPRVQLEEVNCAD